MAFRLQDRPSVQGWKLKSLRANGAVQPKLHSCAISDAWSRGVDSFLQQQYFGFPLSRIVNLHYSDPRWDNIVDLLRIWFLQNFRMICHSQGLVKPTNSLRSRVWPFIMTRRSPGPNSAWCPKKSINYKPATRSFLFLSLALRNFIHQPLMS